MSKGEFEKKITETFGLMYKGTQDIVYVNLGEYLKSVIDEARKDIIETERDLYKQVVEWGNKGEMNVSAAFLRASDAIREKRKKWFGDKDE